LEIKMPNSFAPKLLAEFIGTFALVFIGAGAASIVGGAAGGGITAVAFAHGLTLMIFICAYGSISGGHMNPAVTVGVLAAGAITAAEAVSYIVSQIAGGVAAALLLRIVLGAWRPASARPSSRTASFSAARR
jgi:glycerol uptake facilitator-like aquaporin